MSNKYRIKDLNPWGWGTSLDWRSEWAVLLLSPGILMINFADLFLALSKVLRTKLFPNYNELHWVTASWPRGVSGKYRHLGHGHRVRGWRDPSPQRHPFPQVYYQFAVVTLSAFFGVTKIALEKVNTNLLPLGLPFSKPCSRPTCLKGPTRES